MTIKLLVEQLRTLLRKVDDPNSMEISEIRPSVYMEIERKLEIINNLEANNIWGA